MARSGTSAVTRIINLLGLPVTTDDDMMPANNANPSGFWESEALVKMNDRVLATLGGSWNAPPPLPPGWQDDVRLAELENEARALFARLHRTPQWVWKDPRTTLTFPFWRRTLGVNPVVVLAYRHPLEVVDSLDRGRFGVTPTVALALWERYNRIGLAGAAGHPAFVVRYESLVSQPERTAAEMATFLRAHALRLTSVSPAAAGEFIDPELHRSRVAASTFDMDLSSSQHGLLNAFTELEGPHETLIPPPLSRETPWVEPLFVERRKVLELEREKQALVRLESLEPHRELLGLELRLRSGTTAWRVLRRARDVARHRSR
jgi:hypothetical protein